MPRSRGLRAGPFLNFLEWLYKVPTLTNRGWGTREHERVVRTEYGSAGTEFLQD